MECNNTPIKTSQEMSRQRRDKIEKIYSLTEDLYSRHKKI